MSIHFDYNAALSDLAGDHGVRIADLEALAGRTREIHASLAARHRGGELGFYNLPDARDEAAAIKRFADARHGRFDAFVHLGIGGSGLGPICVQAALNHPLYNEDAQYRNGWPKLYVLDNVDPEQIAAIAAAIDPARTMIHVVSKSGTTPETMTQFMVFWQRMKQALGEKKAVEHVVFTTDPKSGVLRALANAKGFATFPIPPNVGGRFSVLTAVGLLPAAMTGLDPSALLEGAATMAGRCSTDDLFANPAYLNAAIHFLADTKLGKSISVMMPYAQSLRWFADWYAQLWAESLGKRVDTAGRVVHVGQTPVGALGATDQHSQVQLYTEGPNDKIFTFLRVERFREQCQIPEAEPGLEEMSHFGGVDMGALLNAEKSATEFALTAAQRPSVTLALEAIDAPALGGLIHLYQVQTAFAGDLYDIDAFNQPGVEEGKKATHALLGRGRPEDAAKLAEVEAWRERFTRKPV